MTRQFSRASLALAIVGVCAAATLVAAPATAGGLTAGVRAAAIPAPGTYISLTPARILDTRTGNGAAKAAVAAGGTVVLQVTGRGGVSPGWVGAVMLNVTVTQPAVGGHVTVYPTGTTRPNASNLNFVRGQTVSNLVAVSIGSAGRVNLYNATSGTLHLVADVAGYYWDGGPLVPGVYQSLDPARILDTRTGNGATRAAVASGGTIHLQVTGRGGVPVPGGAAEAGAVLLNVTVTQSVAGGHVTVYPTGTTRPNASNLNFRARQTVANLAAVKLGTGGRVDLYNATSATLHLVADVAGFFQAGAVNQPNAFQALDPARILDTRTGNGATRAALAAGHTLNLQVTGRGGVSPAGASGVLLNVTVTQPAVGGHVTVYPTGTARPNVSNLNFVRGQTVANLVAVKLGGAGGQVTFYNATSGTLHLVADVAGYYGMVT